jgi:putative restriction endonuclease
VAPELLLVDELTETALRLESLEAWSPFVSEERAVYRVAKSKRDAVFRKIVISKYRNTYAITRSAFAYRGISEAQAPHTISKEVNSSDDPRNGIAMSHTSHWAFDRGIFAISDQYEILAHPRTRDAYHQDLRILEPGGARILSPDDELVKPHKDALRWHKDEVYGRFAR